MLYISSFICVPLPPSLQFTKQTQVKIFLKSHTILCHFVRNIVGIGHFAVLWPRPHLLILYPWFFHGMNQQPVNLECVEAVPQLKHWGGTPFTVSLPICNVQQATEHLTFKLPFPIWIEMPSSPFFIGQWHSSWLHLISLKHLFLQHQIPLLTQIRWHVSPKTGLIDVTCYSSGWVFLQFHPYKVSTLP